MRSVWSAPSILTGIACALALATSTGADDLLPVEEILLTLPGTWELDPAEVSEEARGDFRCDASPQVINIEQTETGWVYHTMRVGKEDEARRAPIRGLATPNGPAPLIHIKYDNEQRRTEDTGELVEWLLMMPDRNHFFWIRTDWPAKDPGSRTSMRRRCDLSVA